jgi:hypothetical protein
VIDWRSVRLAVGVTQAELAAVVGVSRRELQRLEAGERGAGPGVLARLASFLTLRGPRARLKAAGVAHPFGAEVAAAVAAWNRIAGRRPRAGPALPCAVCGVPLGLHARCQRCPQLLGDAHAQPAAPDGLCRGCRERARRSAGRRRSAA